MFEDIDSFEISVDPLSKNQKLIFDHVRDKLQNKMPDKAVVIKHNYRQQGNITDIVRIRFIPHNLFNAYYYKDSEEGLSGANNMEVIIEDFDIQLVDIASLPNSTRFLP